MSFDFKNGNAGDRGFATGKAFVQGVGIGMSEQSYRAITAMENVYVELESLSKNAAKNAENLEKKRLERKMDNLENALKLELICEQEYYEKLKVFRDENLRQGSDLWYRCTEEIAEYNQRMLEETQRQYDKIIALREELTQKLSNKLEGNEPWLEASRVTFKGLRENGADLVYNDTELKSFREEVLLLESYRDKILELKALKNVPQEIFSDIAGMNVEEGLQAANAILLTDEAARNRFFSEYAEHKSAADRISTELLDVLYGDELQKNGALGSAVGQNGKDGKSEIYGNLTELLAMSFEDVPEGYYFLGAEAGGAFGEGFLSKIPELMELVRGYFVSEINELGGQIAAAMQQSVRSVADTASNIYNTSYTFNSSKDTTTQQLAAARNAATLERLRGGSEK